MPLFAELKRRNVFKVGAAYLALAWLVLQLTSIVVPELGLPAWTTKFVIWFGVIGFPCVLIVAWVYELTPEGLKRESEVARSQSITHVTGKRLDYLIIVLLVVAIGVSVLQYLRPPAPEGPAAAAVAATPGTSPAVQAEPLAPLQPATAILPDDKSIAVLPFADMSQSKDQEYFSDGISEELLNLLAQVQDLKVIARTSSFAFKGKDVPIAEIARQLNVAHVLEGSVRKVGNQVRITAQLIRTADSTHLWSDSYDRPLDDVFKVQDEIANAIVQALQIRLAGGTLSRRGGGTQNFEAYQLYLRAMTASRERTSQSLDAAGGYLEQALKLDPDYGMALASLSSVASDKADIGLVDAKEGYAQATKLARQAVQLSPGNATAHARLQYIYLTCDWDWAAAEAEGRLARAIDATDSEVQQIAGVLSLVRSRWEDAEAQYKELLVLDPLNPYVLNNLGYTYYGAGRFEDAERVLRKLLAMQGDFAGGANMLGSALLAQGKTLEALAVVQQQADEGQRLRLLPVFLHAAGREAEADEAMVAQRVRWERRGAYSIAATYAYRGDRDRAMEWLERAYTQKDVWLSWILGEQLFNGMYSDPRFIAFLKKMNLPTEPVPVN